MPPIVRKAQNTRNSRTKIIVSFIIHPPSVDWHLQASTVVLFIIPDFLLIDGDESFRIAAWFSIFLRLDGHHPANTVFLLACREQFRDYGEHLNLKWYSSEVVYAIEEFRTFYSKFGHLSAAMLSHLIEKVRKVLQSWKQNQVDIPYAVHILLIRLDSA